MCGHMCFMVFYGVLWCFMYAGWIQRDVQGCGRGRKTTETSVCMCLRRLPGFASNCCGKE